MTVTGKIDKRSLGVTSPHEHALIDITNQYPGAAANDNPGWTESVGPKWTETLWKDPYFLKDNLVLDDHGVCLSEIRLAMEAGLKTFVDVTPDGVGRDPLFLRRVSEQTGLQVVAATGLYTSDAQPKAAFEMDEDALSNWMRRELTEGIGGTGIRAGIIGEIGTSRHIDAQEKKVLRAAAKTQTQTGSPIMVHLFPWGNGGLEALHILRSAGVEANHICLCHTDVALDGEYMRALLREGVYLEFDNFGKEFGEAAYGRFPGDDERLKVMYELIDEGYLSQLLVSCDVCLKVLLTAYGGQGYCHVLRNIVDSIRRQRRDSKRILDSLLIDNPANYLDNPNLNET